MHRTNKILNVRLTTAITALKWGEVIVVSDAGLPDMKDVEVLDLSITANNPEINDVIPAIIDSLTIDRVLVASEMEKVNKKKFDYVKSLFPEKLETMGNLELEEELMSKAKLVVRTGDTSPYGNVVFVGGLDFFQLGMAD